MYLNIKNNTYKYGYWIIKLYYFFCWILIKLDIYFSLNLLSFIFSLRTLLKEFWKALITHLYKNATLKPIIKVSPNWFIKFTLFSIAHCINSLYLLFVWVKSNFKIPLSKYNNGLSSSHKLELEFNLELFISVFNCLKKD